MRILHIAAPLVAVAIAAGFAPQPEFIIAPDPELPAISLVGPNSSIHERRFERIRDENAWKALWAQHARNLTPNAAQGWTVAPRVDFKRYEVIAFFRGDALNHSGEVVESIVRGPELTVLRFDSLTFQTASALNAPSSASSGVECSPYGIWVIPRSTRPVIIEENVQGMKDHPAVWQQQFRFSAAQDDGC